MADLSRAVGWFSPRMKQELQSGDEAALLEALLLLSARWMDCPVRRLPVHRPYYPMTSAVVSSKNGEARSAQELALLAAGCDLVDLLTSTPQGREAFLKLAFQPVLEKPITE